MRSSLICAISAFFPRRQARFARLPPLALIVFGALFAPACAHNPPADAAPLAAKPAPVAAAPAKTPSSPAAFSQVGMASWYGPGFEGKLTANGERFDPDAMTCAHPKLKFGTKVEVTNLENGKSVIVRVNDRGPFAKNRVIDLSKEAAKRLGFIDKGVAKVRVEVVTSVATKP